MWFTYVHLFACWWLCHAGRIIVHPMVELPVLLTFFTGCVVGTSLIQPIHHVPMISCCVVWRHCYLHLRNPPGLRKIPSQTRLPHWLSPMYKKILWRRKFLCCIFHVFFASQSCDDDDRHSSASIRRSCGWSCLWLFCFSLRSRTITSPSVRMASHGNNTSTQQISLCQPELLFSSK